MGLFDAILDNVSIDLLTPGEARGIRKARELAESGDRVEGTLTGIRRRWQDTVSQTFLRLEWPDTTERVAGVELITDWLIGLRLGSTVPLRISGDQAVVDWASYAAQWRMPTDPAQRFKRAPDAGIDDSAQDMRILGKLKKAPPQPATVVALERKVLMGMKTEDWVITLAARSGATLVSMKTGIPFYAAWFVAEGAEVPVVEYEPGKAVIDWPQLALDRQATAGRWQDPLPPGSVAELRIQETADLRPDEDTSTAPVDTTPVDVTPPAEGLEPIAGVTLEQWALVSVGKEPQPPTWAEADAGWKARMMSDWRIGAAMGEAAQNARKRKK